MLDIQIGTEVAVTLVAALVVALIVIVANQRNASRRARLKDNIQLLESEKDLKRGAGDFERLIKPKLESYVKKERPRVSVGFLCGVLFWIAVFVAFSWWSFVLFNQGFIVWAPLAGFFALLGLVMPFIAWDENRHANKGIDRLVRGIDAYEESLVKHEKAVKEAAVRLRAAETKHEAEEETVVKVPEDSTLRRHFLTHLSAEIEAGLPPRPTDSALRRHHDAMIDAELDKRLGGQLSELRAIEARPRAQAEPAPVAETKVKHEAEQDSRVEVPEDSTLKRHFLTHLRSEIEAGFPPRPSDSALRRHHGAMIDAELDKRLGGQLSELRAVEEAPKTPARPMPVAEAKVKHEAEQDRGLKVPEDSTLSRHFRTNLREEVESRMPPRPTDSALRRHHDAMIDAEMEKRLAGQNV